jgi:hypothetical protein
MAPSPSNPVTGPRIFLGLFILGQLCFLFASNFLGLLQESKDYLPERWKAPIERLAPGFTKQEGPVWELSKTLTGVTKIWDQATGQSQAWSLFAPGVSNDCTFLALELRWDEAPEVTDLARGLNLLAAGTPLEATVLAGLALKREMLQAPELWLSDNEPADIAGFFRIGNFRFRKFENNLALDLVPEENPEETAERWRDKIGSHLKTEGYLILPYMKWRLQEIQRKIPGRPQPRQVILVMRRYRILDPKDGGGPWEGPDSNPVARWQPAVKWSAEYSPLEMFNPVTRRFESMLK